MSRLFPLFQRITRPTLILDESRAEQNIRRMADKAHRNNVRFRPHFKTHQSADFSCWFRERGVTQITVSSVCMAEYFRRAGWQDITIAFSLNPRELPAINRLALQIQLGLLVENVDGVEALASGLKHPADIWIKVDVGAKRTGIPVRDHASVIQLAQRLEVLPRAVFRGILTHAGQTYHAHSPEEVQCIYDTAMASLLDLKQALIAAGFPSSQISWGDTPTCSLVRDLSALDEIRPGNFVLYDATQLAVGSCREEDIAAAVACPVVAKHPDRNEVIIHGGAVHLSKETMTIRNNLVLGLVALPADQGWSPILPGCRVQALSQEHGIVRVTQDVMKSIQVGDLLMIIPVHACLTVNLHQQYTGLSGRRYRIMR